MTEEERLEITSVVEDEFSDALERFEEALEDTDREIAETGGGGGDEINVDIDIDIGTATAELEAIEQQLDSLDDRTVTVDVDRDTAALATSGGRPSIDTNASDSDILNRQMPAIAGMLAQNSAFRNAGLTEGVDIEDAVGATTANPPTHFAQPFGSGRTADDRRMKELMDLFDGEAGKLQRQIDALDNPVDKLLFGDSDVEHTMDERREIAGIEISDDPAEDMMSFADDPRIGKPSFSKRLRNILDPDKERDLSKLTERLTFTMGKFYQLFAALIPLVAVFGAALPAAITGVAALGAAAIATAAALGGVAALGGAGLSLQQTGEMSMDPIAEQSQEVQDAFASAFAPLARKFAPVFRDALNSIEMMAGPLAQASDGLLGFRDMFSGVVEFITTNLPPAIETALAFAQAAAPLLSVVVDTLTDANIAGFLGKQFSEALPELAKIGALFVEMLPAIVKVSQGFLSIAGAVAYVLTPIVTLINQVPMLGQVIGLLTGALLLASSAASLKAIAVTGLTGSLLGYLKVIYGPVQSALATYIGSTMAAVTATLALASAIAIATAGLSVGAGMVASKFGVMSGDIKNARKELEKFNKTGNALGSTSIGGPNKLGEGGGSVYQDNSTTIIDASDRDAAAREQYSSEYERQQHIDSVFGG